MSLGILFIYIFLKYLDYFSDGLGRFSPSNNLKACSLGGDWRNMGAMGCPASVNVAGPLEKYHPVETQMCI